MVRPIIKVLENVEMPSALFNGEIIIRCIFKKCQSIRTLALSLACARARALFACIVSIAQFTFPNGKERFRFRTRREGFS